MIDNQKVIETEFCAICGGLLGRELLTITEPDRFERHLGIPVEGYVRRWMECSVCGGVTNCYPPGVEKKLANLAEGYYEVDFKSSTINQKYESVMALPADKSDNAQRVARIREFMNQWKSHNSENKHRLVLDIGAGTGVFLSRFLQESTASGDHWYGIGVEPDPIASAHLRNLELFGVVEETFKAGDEFHDFDLCTLNKVLEHLPKPLDLLREIATALNPLNGVLYVEVPAKETLFYRPPNDNILGALHRHLYDITSLDKILAHAGLTTMRIDRLLEPSGKISIVAFAVRAEAAIVLCHGDGK